VLDEEIKWNRKIILKGISEEDLKSVSIMVVQLIDVACKI
jgi:hypothetical protein